MQDEPERKQQKCNRPAETLEPAASRSFPTVGGELPASDAESAVAEHNGFASAPVTAPARPLLPATLRSFGAAAIPPRRVSLPPFLQGVLPDASG